VAVTSAHVRDVQKSGARCGTADVRGDAGVLHRDFTAAEIQSASHQVAGALEKVRFVFNLKLF